MKFMYRLLVFLLGFIMGVTGCIGGMVGGIYYAYTNLTLKSIYDGDLPFVFDGPNFSTMTPQEIMSRLMSLISGDVGTITLGSLQSTYGLDLSKLLGFEIPESVLNEWALDAIFEEGGVTKFLEGVTVGSLLDLLDAFGFTYIRDYIPGAAAKLKDLSIGEITEEEGWLKLVEPLNIIDILPDALFDLLWGTNESHNLRGLCKLLVALGGVNIGEIIHTLMKKEGSKPILNVLVQTESVSQFDLGELIPDNIDSLKPIKDVLQGITIGMLFEEKEDGTLVFNYYKALKVISLSDLFGIINMLVPGWMEKCSDGVKAHLDIIGTFSLFYILFNENGAGEIVFKETMLILKILLGDLTIEDVVRTIVKIINGTEDISFIYRNEKILGNLYYIFAAIRLIDVIMGIATGDFDSVKESLRNVNLNEIFGSYFDDIRGRLTENGQDALDKILSVTVDDIFNALQGDAEAIRGKIDEVSVTGILEVLVLIVESYIINNPLPDLARKVLDVIFKNLADITVKNLREELLKGNLTSFYNALYNFTVREILDILFIAWPDWLDKVSDNLRSHLINIGSYTLKDILKENGEDREIVEVLEILLGNLTVDDIIRTVIKFINGNEDLSFIYDLTPIVGKVYDILSGIELISFAKAIINGNLGEIIDNDIKPVTVYELFESYLTDFFAKLSEKSKQAVIDILSITIGDIISALDGGSFDPIMDRIGHVLITDLLSIAVDLINNSSELPVWVRMLIDNVFNSLDKLTIKSLFEEVFKGDLNTILENGLYTLTIGELLDPIFIAADINPEDEAYYPLGIIYARFKIITIGQLAEDWKQAISDAFRSLTVDDLVGKFINDFLNNIEDENLTHVISTVYGVFASITIGEILDDYKVLFRALTYITVGDVFGMPLGYNKVAGAWIAGNDEDRLLIFERFANEAIYDILFDFEYLRDGLLHEITIGDVFNLFHYFFCGYNEERDLLFEIDIIEALAHGANSEFYEMYERLAAITVSALIHRYIDCENHPALSDEDFYNALGDGRVGDLISLVLACLNSELRFENDVWVLDGDILGKGIDTVLNILLMDVAKLDWEAILEDLTLRDFVNLLSDILRKLDYYPEILDKIDSYFQFVENLEAFTLYQIFVNLGLIEGIVSEYQYFDILFDQISFGMIIDDVIYIVNEKERIEQVFSEDEDLNWLVHEILNNLREFFILETKVLLEYLEEEDGLKAFLRELTKEIFGDITVQQLLDALMGKGWEPEELINIDAEIFREIMALKIWELFDYVLEGEYLNITIQDLFELLDLKGRLEELGIGWIYGLIILILGRITVEDLLTGDLRVIFGYVTIGEIIDVCIDYELFTEEDLESVIFTDAALYLRIRAVRVIDIIYMEMDEYEFDNVTIGDILDVFFRPDDDIALNGLYLTICSFVVVDLINGDFDFAEAIGENSVGEAIDLIIALLNEFGLLDDFNIRDMLVDHIVLLKLYENLGLVLFNYIFEADTDAIINALLYYLTFGDVVEQIITLLNVFVHDEAYELGEEITESALYRKIAHVLIYDLIYDDEVLDELLKEIKIQDVIDFFIVCIDPDREFVDAYIAPTLQRIIRRIALRSLYEAINDPVVLFVDFINEAYIGDFVEALIWYLIEDTINIDSCVTLTVLRDNLNNLVLVDFIDYINHGLYEELIFAILVDIDFRMILMDLFFYDETDLETNNAYIRLISIYLTDLIFYEDVFTDYVENVKANEFFELIVILLLGDLYYAVFADRLIELIDELLDFYLIDYDLFPDYLSEIFNKLTFGDIYLVISFYLPVLDEIVTDFGSYLTEFWNALLGVHISIIEEELEEVIREAKVGFIIDIVLLLLGDSGFTVYVKAYGSLVNEAIMGDLIDAIDEGALNDMLNGSFYLYTKALFRDKTVADLVDVMIDLFGYDIVFFELFLELFGDLELAVFGDPTPDNIFRDIKLGDVIGEILGWEQIDGIWDGGLLYPYFEEYANMRIVELLDELLGDIHDYLKTLIALFIIDIALLIYVILVIVDEIIADIRESTLRDVFEAILDIFGIDELPNEYRVLNKFLENLEKIKTEDFINGLYDGFNLRADLIDRIFEGITLADVIYDIFTLIMNLTDVDVTENFAPAIFDMIDYVGAVTVLRFIDDPMLPVIRLINYVTVGHIIDILFYYLGLDEIDFAYETTAQIYENIKGLAVVDLIDFIYHSEIREFIVAIIAHVDLGMILRDILFLIGFEYDESALLDNNAYVVFTQILLSELVFELEDVLVDFTQRVTANDIKELIVLLAGLEDLLDDYIAPRLHDILSDLLDFFLSEYEDAQYFFDVLSVVTWGDLIEIADFYLSNFGNFNLEEEILDLPEDVQEFINGLRPIELSDLDSLRDHCYYIKLGVIVSVISMFFDNEYFIAFSALVSDAAVGDLIDAVNEGAFEDIGAGSLYMFMTVLFTGNSVNDLLVIVEDLFEVDFQSANAIIDLFRDLELAVLFGDPTPENVFRDITLGEIFGELLEWENDGGVWVGGTLFSLLEEYANMTITDILDELFGDMHDYLKTAITIFAAAVVLIVYIVVFEELINDILDSTIKEIIAKVLGIFAVEFEDEYIYVTLNKLLENLDALTLRELITSILESDDAVKEALTILLKYITLGDVLYDIFEILGIEIEEILAPAIIEVIDTLGALFFVDIIFDPYILLVEFLNCLTVGCVIDIVFYYLDIEEEGFEYETLNKLIENVKSIYIIDIIGYFNNDEIDTFIDAVLKDIDLGMIIRDIAYILGYELNEEVLLENNAYAIISVTLLADIILDSDTVNEILGSITANDVYELIILLADIEEAVDEYVAPKLQEIITLLLDFYLNDIDSLYLQDILYTITWGDIIEIADFYLFNFLDIDIEEDISALPEEARIFVNGIRPIEVYDIDSLFDYCYYTKLAVIISIITIFFDNEYFVAFSALISEAAIGELVDALTEGDFKLFTEVLFSGNTVGDLLLIIEEQFHVDFSIVDGLLGLFRDLTLAVLFSDPSPENIFRDITVGDILGEILDWDYSDGIWIGGILFSFMEEYANMSIVELLTEYLGGLHEYLQTLIAILTIATISVIYSLFLFEFVEDMFNVSLRVFLEDILVLFGIQLPDTYETLNKILENLDEITLKEFLISFDEFSLRDDILIVIFKDITVADIVYDLLLLVGIIYEDIFAPAFIEIIDNVGGTTLIEIYDDPAIIFVRFISYVTLSHLARAVFYYLEIDEEMNYETMQQFFINLKAIAIVDLIIFFKEEAMDEFIEALLYNITLGMILRDFTFIIGYELNEDILLDNNAYALLEAIYLGDLILHLDYVIEDYTVRVTAEEVKELVVLLADLKDFIDEFVAPKLQEIISLLLDFFICDYEDTQYFFDVLHTTTWGDLIEIADFYLTNFLDIYFEDEIAGLPNDVVAFIDEIRLVEVYDTETLLDLVYFTKLGVIISVVTIFFDNEYFIAFSSLIEDALLGELKDALEFGDIIDFMEALFTDNTVDDLILIVEDLFEIDFSLVDRLLDLFRDLKLAVLFSDPTPENIFRDITLGDILGEILDWDYSNGIWIGGILFSFIEEYANLTIVEILGEFLGELSEYLQTLIGIITIAIITVVYSVFLFEFIEDTLNASLRTIIEDIFDQFEIVLPDEFTTLNKFLENLDKITLKEFIQSIEDGLYLRDDIIAVFFDEITVADIIYDLLIIADIAPEDIFASTIIEIIDSVGKTTILEIYDDNAIIFIRFINRVTLSHILYIAFYYIGIDEDDFNWETIQQLFENLKNIAIVDVMIYVREEDFNGFTEALFAEVTLGMITRDLFFILGYGLNEEILLENNAYKLFEAICLVDLILHLDFVIEDFIEKVIAYDIYNLIIMGMDLYDLVDEFIAPSLQELIAELLDFYLCDYNDAQHFIDTLATVTWGDLVKIADFYLIYFINFYLENRIDELPDNVKEFIDELLLIEVYDIEALLEQLYYVKLGVFVSVINQYFNNEYLEAFSTLISDAVLGELIDAIKYSEPFIVFTTALFGEHKLENLLDICEELYGSVFESFTYIVDLFCDLELAVIFGDPTPENIFRDITLSDIVGEILGWEYSDGEWTGGILYFCIADLTDRAIVEIIDDLLGGVNEYLQTLVAVAVLATIGFVYSVFIAEFVNKVLESTLKELLEKILDLFGFVFSEDYVTLNKLFENLDEITLREFLEILETDYVIFEDLLVPVLKGILLADIIYDLIDFIGTLLGDKVLDVAPSIYDIIDHIGGISLLTFIDDTGLVVDELLDYLTLGHFIDAIYYYLDIIDEDFALETVQLIVQNLRRMFITDIIDDLTNGDYENLIIDILNGINIATIINDICYLAEIEIDEEIRNNGAYMNFAAVLLTTLIFNAADAITAYLDKTIAYDVYDLTIIIFGLKEYVDRYIAPELQAIISDLLDFYLNSFVADRFVDVLKNVTWGDLILIIGFYLIDFMDIDLENEIMDLPKDVEDFINGLRPIKISDFKALSDYCRLTKLAFIIGIITIFFDNRYFIGFSALISDALVGDLLSALENKDYQGFMRALFTDNTVDDVFNIIEDTLEIDLEGIAYITVLFSELELAVLFGDPTPENVFRDITIGDIIGELLDWKYSDGQWKSGLFSFVDDFANMTIVDLLEKLLGDLHKYLQTLIAFIVAGLAGLLFFIYDRYLSESVNEFLDTSIRKILTDLLDLLQKEFPEGYETIDKILNNLDEITLREIINIFTNNFNLLEDIITPILKDITFADVIYDIIEIITKVSDTGKTLDIAPALLEIIDHVGQFTLIRFFSNPSDLIDETVDYVTFGHVIDTLLYYFDNYGFVEDNLTDAFKEFRNSISRILLIDYKLAYEELKLLTLEAVADQIISYVDMDHDYKEYVSPVLEGIIRRLLNISIGECFELEHYKTTFLEITYYELFDILDWYSGWQRNIDSLPEKVLELQDRLWLLQIGDTAGLIELLKDVSIEHFLLIVNTIINAETINDIISRLAVIFESAKFYSLFTVSSFHEFIEILFGDSTLEPIITLLIDHSVVPENLSELIQMFNEVLLRNIFSDPTPSNIFFDYSIGDYIGRFFEWDYNNNTWETSIAFLHNFFGKDLINIPVADLLALIGVSEYLQTVIALDIIVHFAILYYLYDINLSAKVNEILDSTLYNFVKIVLEAFNVDIPDRYVSLNKLFLNLDNVTLRDFLAELLSGDADYVAIFYELFVNITVADIIFDIIRIIEDITHNEIINNIAPTLQGIINFVFDVEFIYCLKFEAYKDRILDITYYELFDILDWYTGWQRTIDGLPEKFLSEIQDRLWGLRIGDIDGLKALLKDITLEHVIMLVTYIIGDNTATDIINNLAYIFENAKLYTLFTSSSYREAVRVLFSDNRLEPIIDLLIEYNVIPDNLQDVARKFNGVKLADVFADPTPLNIFFSYSIGDYIGNLMGWTYNGFLWTGGPSLLHNFTGRDLINTPLYDILSLTGLHQYLQTAFAFGVTALGVLGYLLVEPHLTKTLDITAKFLFEAFGFEYTKYKTLVQLVENLTGITWQDLFTKSFKNNLTEALSRINLGLILSDFYEADEKVKLSNAYLILSEILLSDLIFNLKNTWDSTIRSLTLSDILKITLLIVDKDNKVDQGIAPEIQAIIYRILDVNIESCTNKDHYIEALKSIKYLELFDAIDWYTGVRRFIDRMPEFALDYFDELLDLYVYDYNTLIELIKTAKLEHVFAVVGLFFSDEYLALAIEILGGATIYNLYQARNDYKAFITELFRHATLKPLIDLLIDRSDIPDNIKNLLILFEDVTFYNIFVDPTPTNVFGDHSLGEFIGAIAGWSKGLNGKYTINPSFLHNLFGLDFINDPLRELLGLIGIKDYFRTLLAVVISVSGTTLYMILKDFIEVFVNKPIYGLVNELFKILGLKTTNQIVAKLLDNSAEVTYKELFTKPIKETINKLLNEISLDDFVVMVFTLFKKTDFIERSEAFMTKLRQNLKDYMLFDLLFTEFNFKNTIIKLFKEITAGEAIDFILVLNNKRIKEDIRVLTTYQELIGIELIRLINEFKTVYDEISYRISVGGLIELVLVASNKIKEVKPGSLEEWVINNLKTLSVKALFENGTNLFNVIVSGVCLGDLMRYTKEYDSSHSSYKWVKYDSNGNREVVELGIAIKLMDLSLVDLLGGTVDLKNLINNSTVGDLLDTTSSAVLRCIEDFTIGDIENGIRNISLAALEEDGYVGTGILRLLLNWQYVVGGEIVEITLGNLSEALFAKIQVASLKELVELHLFEFPGTSGEFDTQFRALYEYCVSCGVMFSSDAHDILDYGGEFSDLNIGQFIDTVFEMINYIVTAVI